MSNAVYPKALEHFGQADINYLSDDVRVQLVGAGYVYDADHETTADIDVADTIGSSVALVSKSIIGGEFFAASVTVPAVPSGDTVTAIVVYVETTGYLLAYIDTRADTVPISIVTNDGDIEVEWPLGRIFKI